MGRAFQIMIEGARMSACPSCASLGKPVADKPTPRTFTPRSRPLTPVSVPRGPRAASLPSAYDQLELDDDYSTIIKQARTRANLSQEELARAVKEKLSVIQKIELRKMIPNMKLSRALEHVLRIKLLVPASELPVPLSRQKPAPEVTLADIAKIKAKDKDSIPI